MSRHLARTVNGEFVTDVPEPSDGAMVVREDRDHNEAYTVIWRDDDRASEDWPAEAARGARWFEEEGICPDTWAAALRNVTAVRSVEAKPFARAGGR